VIREHPLAPWFAVASVCFGAFMGQLDASALAAAGPALDALASAIDRLADAADPTDPSSR
jgi:hypothetical protein